MKAGDLVGMQAGGQAREEETLCGKIVGWSSSSTENFFLGSFLFFVLALEVAESLSRALSALAIYSPHCAILH